MVNILPEPEISDALDYAVVLPVRRVQLHAAPHPDRKLSRTTKSKYQEKASIGRGVHRASSSGGQGRLKLLDVMLIIHHCSPPNYR